MLNVLLQAANRGHSVLSIFRHLGAFGYLFLTILDSSPLPTFGGPDSFRLRGFSRCVVVGSRPLEFLNDPARACICEQNYRVTHRRYRRYRARWSQNGSRPSWSLPTRTRPNRRQN